VITTDAVTQAVLQRSFQLHVRAESWLGGELLADDIPIDAGGEEGDAAAAVPERVTLTVPARDRGVSWSPVVGSPLAADGQRLRVELGVSVGRGQITWMQRGWFVITGARLNGRDGVDVEAANLLWLIKEADLVSPLQPNGTMLSTVRTLVEPTLAVRDIGLTDRAVPAGTNFDESRLSGLFELLDAWPARGRVTEDGALLLTQDVPPTASLRSYTDGPGGTIVEVTGSSSRTGGFSLVVARGQDSAGNVVQGVAYNDSGPRAFGGPFNPQPVPKPFFSPLLTTVDQARAAAQTVLARHRRASGREFLVEMVPDPTLQLGDPVDVTTDDVAGLLCTIERYRMPYVADGGPMTATVRSVA
jgi:hypothetical protein